MLYTFDFDNISDIRIEANIIRVKNLSIAENRYNDLNPERYIIDWRAGRFNEYWTRIFRVPQLYLDTDKNGSVIIDDIPCVARLWNAYPGKWEWWLYPADPVYIPVYSD